MEPKQNFAIAFGNLMVKDADNVREFLSKKCRWSAATFWQKKTGARGCQNFNSYRKNEVAIIEQQFATYGLNAWTGERINTI